MKIALDARPLQNESGGRGVGRYVSALLSEPGDGAHARHPVVSAWLPFPAMPPAARQAAVRLRRPPRAITFFDQIATPMLCTVRGFDLWHATFYAVPRFMRAGTARVITTHDLIPLLFPKAVGPKNRKLFEIIYRSARYADRVIVPSRRTADDLMRLVAIEADRIRVVPMGVGEPFVSDETIAARTTRGTPAPEAPVPEPIVRALASGRPVLLYSGGFNATKNVTLLLEALARTASRDAVLGLVGDPGRAQRDLAEIIDDRGLGGRVIFLGRLEDEQLAAAYRAATLFVSASSYEGFGLPALEAMACGCPVVARSTAAVPEVLGGAAVEVSSQDSAAFAALVDRALTDEALRRELRRQGIARAADLTWTRTVRDTESVYEEAALARRR